MEWLASGLQTCLGLVVSENLLPSLRNSPTHTHTHNPLCSTGFEATRSGSKPKIFHIDHVYVQQVDVSLYYMQIPYLRVKS